MTIARTTIVASLTFVAGFAVSASGWPTRVAVAQGAPLAAQIVDVNALDGEALGPIRPGTELRSKLVVATDGATVAVQQGNVPKHYHAQSDEIQYVVAGTGTIWLGDRERPLKPGDLVVIPRGTVHAGTVPTSGTFKSIAIKVPPQGADDQHYVP